MRKKNIWKQLLSLTLSGVLLLGSAPVSGEELFSESEDTLYTGVEAQVFQKRKPRLFQRRKSRFRMYLQKKIQTRFRMFLRMKQKKQRMKSANFSQLKSSLRIFFLPEK